MEIRTYPRLNETVFFERLSCGLPVAVVPRPGFTKKLCYFVTDYGSVHRVFTLDGVPMEAPAGVAHYLEHKLFDMPDRDITAEFAALGAIPNAFTSYDLTAYYFSCTEHFEENLKLLLEFVTTPYITEESVQKEQGIIGQEIAMNEDSPETRIFELLMEAMYENHPVREPILGTRESIAKITPQVLSDCHRAFYRPSNMLLCVVGDVDARQVCQLAESCLTVTGAPAVTATRQWQESMEVRSPFVSTRMDVAMPTFQLGFKCEQTGLGPEAVRRELIGDLAAEALFGESSALYLRLYEEGIIDSSFGGGFETMDGMAMLTAYGDSDFPEKIKEAIMTRAKEILQEGICPEDFLRMKRSILGRRIRDLDSFEATCFRICAYHFSAFDYFSFPEVYKTVEIADVYEFIARVVTPERCALCVIYPLEQEETDDV